MILTTFSNDFSSSCFIKHATFLPSFLSKSIGYRVFLKCRGPSRYSKSYDFCKSFKEVNLGRTVVPYGAVIASTFSKNYPDTLGVFQNIF